MQDTPMGIRCEAAVPEHSPRRAQNTPRSSPRKPTPKPTRKRNRASLPPHTKYCDWGLQLRSTIPGHHAALIPPRVLFCRQIRPPNGDFPCANPSPAKFVKKPRGRAAVNTWNRLCAVCHATNAAPGMQKKNQLAHSGHGFSGADCNAPPELAIPLKPRTSAASCQEVGVVRPDLA